MTGFPSLGTRRALGLLTLATAALFGGRALFRGGESAAARRIAFGLVRSPVRREAIFRDPVPAAPGDAVYAGTHEDPIAAGRVESVLDGPGGRTLVLRVYPDLADRLCADAELVAWDAPGTIGWILGTLFPPAFRERAVAEFVTFLREEGPRHVEAFRPAFAALLNRAADRLAADWPGVVAKHRDRFEALGRRLEVDVLGGILSPSLRQDAWPILRRHAQPVVASVAKEIWEKAPTTSFVGNFLLEQLPFTGSDLLEARVNRFLDDEVVPLLEARRTEFAAAAEAAAREILASGAFRGALSTSLRTVLADRGFQALMTDVARDWIIENMELRRDLREVIGSPEFREPLRDLLAALAPRASRLANEVVLDDAGTGIDPALARVLRRQVLRRDPRWFHLRPGTAAAPLVSGTPLGGVRGGP